MRISEIAERLDVSVDWLRRLERSGRLPRAKRDINNHRRYTEEDFERLHALIFGFGHRDDRVQSARVHGRWP
jgi:DNA-binding transcriptional MerR regulator